MNLQFDKKLLLDQKEYNTLVKAIVVFLYKQQNYKESQEIFSLGDEESLYNLFKCKKAYESALISYNNALDNFLAYCNT